ncbi:MAG: GNAT family N-acetyltransferase [Deltaproteobacteria bacterium]|jgi:ribosomal protein S18 acetylase RimI-like enzyme|nr:GNAT family N-acetyltransferase [Deltaproteobacteria bacterium]
MPYTSSVIDALWQERETTIPTNHDKQYKVVYSRPGNFFDIIISHDREPVGFITLKYEGEGTYSIVNDTQINPHPSFINTPGHGIEVKEKFRKRGFGAALLSLGIGIVQRDWQVNKKGGIFKVVASDITKQGLGCYKNFGFTIKEGMQVSAGYYTNPDTVPEISILQRKVFFTKRLKKRLQR